MGRLVLLRGLPVHRVGRGRRGVCPGEVMKLSVLLYRPYGSHYKAFVYDEAGIGQNLLHGRSLTAEASAMTAVAARLDDRYPGVEIEFETREGERYSDLKYQLPSGKVVTVR